MSKPLFSICHTSARPDKWRAVYDDWMGKAFHPENVEYVLCIDPRWGFSTDPRDYQARTKLGPGQYLDNLIVEVNQGRRCYVDGVNTAARASAGSILIVNADDQFACEGWDSLLLKTLQSDFHGIDSADAGFDFERYGRGCAFVVEPSTGTPQEHERAILVMPILSRKRYEDQGSEVFYHGYESMYADNDFCEHARQDGVVIDARHLMFPHKHPMFDQHGWKQGDWGKTLDEQYKAQNSGQANEIGAKLFARRRAAKFASVSVKRSIAFCYPGDDFRGPMVDSLLDLYAHFIDLDFEILKMRSASTIVYETRADIWRTIRSQAARPDLILMLDHDNPLRWDQFDVLLSELDSHPEVDGISAWCWIFDKNKKRFNPSVGLWAPDHLQWQPFDSRFAREIDLKPFECGGLPCILMRGSVIDKAGVKPFRPIVDERLEHDVLGDDFCFFLRAEEGGAKFLVDPKIRVPHLKYVDVEPAYPEEGAPEPVKVACMMRVKNEGRWIRRVIEAVRPLCGSNIFVMEDGSTDGTDDILLNQEMEGKLKLLESPFVGQGLNEPRDKNWLLDKVRTLCPDADWILMPDGDEELEPDGCDKIRRTLESNPPYEAFSLRILNLWNGVDQIRIDGSYGRMGRQSLFRAKTEMEFQSIYDGPNRNHCLLHTSNAPGLGGIGIPGLARLAPLNVCLLHYGNMLREDRIRKRNWILTIDPANEAEDFYRHCVQGDLPEFPANATYKHGGPLEIRKLPAHLVPKWDREVPGPLVGLDIGTMTDEQARRAFVRAPIGQAVTEATLMDAGQIPVELL